MEQPLIRQVLFEHIAKELLHGDPRGLDDETPLLEWGIIDSLSMINLLVFIDEQFGIRVPDDAVTPEHFRDLRSLVALLTTLPKDDELASALDPRGVARTTVPSGTSSEHCSLGDGADYHFLRTSGASPVWVILPSLGSSSSSWADVLRAIAGDQASITVDMAGFGASRSPRSRLTLRDHVESTIGLLEQLRLDDVVLIGHSAGGIMAAEIARRAPERVRALVLTGVGHFDDWRAFWTELCALAESASRFFARAYYSPPALSPRASQLWEQMVATPAYRGFLDEPDFAALPALFDLLRVPTLFVLGANDRIVAAAAVEAASARIAHSRIDRLSRCGHFPEIERSQELLALVRNFLQSCAPHPPPAGGRHG